jgi:predicted MPP superfamily phosphohydrolase
LLPLRAGQMPVRTLCNESVILEHAGAELELIGLHGVHPHDSDPSVIKGILGPKPAGRVRVVLSHFPGRVMSLAGSAVDLVLSGHTHGGQVCLPGGVPIMTHDHLPRRFARGAHRIEQTWLVTSRGCGFSKFALRVFCPAEAIEILLVPQSA